MDSATVPAKKGEGEEIGPNSTDRGKRGSKRHILADATNGVPLAPKISPANRRGSKLLEPLVDAMPAIRQCAGRPRRRPAKRHADKDYDFSHCRRRSRYQGQRSGLSGPAGIPHIVRLCIESGERLGRDSSLRLGFRQPYFERRTSRFRRHGHCDAAMGLRDGLHHRQA